jgi:hypothetical protein
MGGPCRGGSRDEASRVRGGLSGTCRPRIVSGLPAFVSFTGPLAGERTGSKADCAGNPRRLGRPPGNMASTRGQMGLGTEIAPRALLMVLTDQGGYDERAR